MSRSCAAAASLGVVALPAGADEPCGDFGECKVLVEINATDGDIGFHFLGDADDLISMRIDDPNGAKVFENRAFGPLHEQKLTESFGESAEPLCWFDPEEEEDWDEVVTLREFVDRWTAGTYQFRGKSEEGEKLFGATDLSHEKVGGPAKHPRRVDKGPSPWPEALIRSAFEIERCLSDTAAEG